MMRVCKVRRMKLLRQTRGVGGADINPTRYWAESGKTRRKDDLLSVYHGGLMEWTLTVYKLLIARKKVGKPSITSWYLIQTDVSNYHSTSVDCRGRRTSYRSVRPRSIGACSRRHRNCFPPR